MFHKQKTEQANIYNYFKTVYNVICYPSRTFKEFNISYYELICYLVLSTWFYAIIASYLRTLSPYILLLLAPISVIPHTFLTALALYLIFIKLFKAKGTFEDCFKISGYILIALLPFMAVVFIKNRDTLILLLTKALPFIYFLVLTFKASRIRFPALRVNKLVQGNVLASLINLCLSTLIFTINMVILSFMNSIIFHHNYVWKIYYD